MIRLRLFFMMFPNMQGSRVDAARRAWKISGIASDYRAEHGEFPTSEQMEDFVDADFLQKRLAAIDSGPMLSLEEVAAEFGMEDVLKEAQALEDAREAEEAARENKS